jgi:hypothetical protein
VGQVAATTVGYPSIDERRARGDEARKRTPPSAHSGWKPAAACLGDGDAFDKSITNFARRYADQNERDYQQFVSAVKSGRLEALEGV